MLDDAELLYAWRDGDENAGRVLFERHYDGVARFFEYKKVDDDPSDLVQQAFEACIKGRDRIRESGTFRSYLYGVAKRILWRSLRERYRCREEELASSSVHDLAPGPVSLIMQHQEQRALLMALRRLPLQLQTMLELYYWEGLSSAEIHDVLGVKASTVRGLIRRARKLLEVALATESVSPEVVESSLCGLDTWAEELRRGNDDDDDDEGEDE